MAKKKKVKRPHTLTNTASGVAGEARVAAELARCGIQVAKPYWNDDEIDLLVVWPKGRTLYPIPIQVKSLQRLSATSKHNFITGLKKKYVERNPSLCLAIYNPKKDRIWFIDTAARIKKVYAQQKRWPKHVSYDMLGNDDDVRIGLNPLANSCRLNKDWLVRKRDASWLSGRIVRATRPLQNAEILQSVIDHIFVTETVHVEVLGPQ